MCQNLQDEFLRLLLLYGIYLCNINVQDSYPVYSWIDIVCNFRILQA